VCLGGGRGARQLYFILWQFSKPDFPLSLFLYLPISLFLYLPISLFLYLPISLFLYLPISLSFSISLSLSLSLYLSLSLSPYLSLSLSPYLSLSFSISLSLSCSLFVCMCKKEIMGGRGIRIRRRIRTFISDHVYRIIAITFEYIFVQGRSVDNGISAVL
jgi:hypothetical protein